MQGVLSSSGLWGRKNIDGEMEALGCGRVGTCLHELSYCTIDQAGCTAHSQGPYQIQVIYFLFSCCPSGLIFPQRDR